MITKNAKKKTLRADLNSINNNSNSDVEARVKPESENNKEYLIADLMENIRHSFDGADTVIKFSITAKCKHSKRTISNE